MKSRKLRHVLRSNWQLRPARLLRHGTQSMRERLDAIQEAASFAMATSDDGAAFQIMLAGGIHDVLSSSTFDTESARVDLDKRCSRLIASALAFLLRQLTEAAKWGACSEYFTGD